MINKNEHYCISKDDLLADTKLNIEKYGLQVIMVSATNYCPSFAYSIGLTQTYKHPEIICFGLPDEFGHAIINDIASMIQNGVSIDTKKIYTNIFKDSRAAFLKVDKRNIDDYFGAAFNYYGDKYFEAMQLVWTDRNDILPWEDNFEEEFLYKQPLLDRNADFKFYEPKNLATYTTRQWLEEKKDILRVVHDHNGVWQFLTEAHLSFDITTVALEDLIKSDNTLNELFDLDYGETAERSAAGETWIRIKY